MTIEIVTQDSDVDAAPPPVVVLETSTSIDAADAKPPSDDPAPAPVAKSDGKKSKAKAPPRETDGETAALRSVLKAEDMTVREIVEQLGTEGSYTIKISRKDPEYTRDATGKSVLTRGYLETVDRKLDEQWIQHKYGGGTYELTFRKKNGGYITHRTVTIAGEPDVTALPGRPGGLAPVPTNAPPAESTSMAKMAIEMAQSMATKAEERAEKASAHGGSGSDQVVVFLRDELRAAREQAAEQMRMFEVRLAQATKPPEPSAEEKVKDRLLDKLMDNDTARLTAQRNQFESEIRMLKEHALENEKRLREQFERDRQDARNAHEREIALIRGSQETQLAAARSSYDVSLAAATTSFSTQKEIMAAENRRLERDNTELREEVRELRAKKDKTLVEQVKEIQTVKDALGLEDGDDADKGMVEQIVGALTNPEAIAAVSKMMGKDQPPAPPPPPPEAPKPRIIKNADGQKFVLSPDGKTMRPVKPKDAPGSAPGEPPIPHIDPDTVTLVVGYLERALAAGTDPAIVAQSGKAQVPEPVLAAIRDLGGVDAFLSKVAKLPSSSPLTASQVGRNWVRKVSKALVGE